MRHIAAVLYLALAACGQPLELELAPDAPAPGFNSCDPGSPGSGDPSCTGGSGGEGSTCLHTCSSNVECGGARQLCQFCNFGECRSSAPNSLPDILACRVACAGVARPRWCDEGGCALVLGR